MQGFYKTELKYLVFVPFKLKSYVVDKDRYVISLHQVAKKYLCVCSRHFFAKIAPVGTMTLQTRNFCQVVGLLMGSDMLFYKTAYRMTVLYRFLNPLCGQSHNSSGSFEIQKWLSC